MRIQYISCHSVLEYDEVKLLTELGYDVLSNGAYRDPKGAYTLPRPGIPSARFDQQFFDLTANHPKTNLPPELIEPFDVLIFMAGEHEAALHQNWEKIKHKRVILRTIGQLTTNDEARLKRLREEGLEIIRYSPKERNIPSYVGEDAMIRFYKDPQEYMGGKCTEDIVVNFSQSLLARRLACHYDEILGSMVGLNSKIYGSGNNDLGSFNGGEMPHEKMKEILRESRAFLYAGTWPASYTLSLIEAMMTPIPVIAFSKKVAHIPGREQIDFYEVDEIIQNEVNGFIVHNPSEARVVIEKLFKDRDWARQIAARGRETAIEYFGKEKIAKQWKEFLERKHENTSA